jgi:hypothetical protein
MKLRPSISIRFATWLLLSLVALVSVLSSNAQPAGNVRPCAPMSSGMVSWWPAEGNADDIIGVNNGTLVGGASFADGEVGQAFSFDGSSGYVSIPDSPSLDLFTSSITIETWIKANQLTAKSGWMAIVAKGDSSWSLMDTAFANKVYLGLNGVSPSGDLYGTRNVNDGQWHHVAGVYDGTNMFLYVDGTLDASHPATGLITQNSYPMCIGAVAYPEDGVGTGYFFNGLVDEVSIYNRALTAVEIQAIYAAGGGGKCYTPTPAIYSQPTDQTVSVGGVANFSVAASGAPLSYQWSFEGTNIVGATNTLLTLTNVQLSQGGNYNVLVSNAYGSVLSSNAVLTVNPLPPCALVSSGMVSWWPAEGNADDIIGTNNGVVEGTLGFAPGEVGQAFLFNTINADVRIPATTSLNVGIGDGLTLEGWIDPSNALALNPLFEWNNGSGGLGVQFWEGAFASGNSSLYANLVDSSGNNNIIISSAGVVASNVFQHVALTYDKASGVATMYCNGAVVAQQTMGSFTPQTTYDLYLGRRISGADICTFSGLMDEVSIYNRALTAVEIQAIYAAGSGGKCYTPTPAIYSQPTNQTVYVGFTAAFSVAASGTPPLSYQWSFEGTNIVGATNTLLTLGNVQLSQGGNYNVLVSNAYGSVLSSNAVLTVNPLPPCALVSSGMVSWWPAEGNADDIIGTNNGVVEGTLGFAPGEVGQAFLFNTINADVRIPATTSLNVGIGDGLTLEGWIDPSNALALNPLFEWNNGSGGLGVQFWEGAFASGNSSLYANLVDSSGNNNIIISSAGVVASNVFQHVALTYDKASGVATMYCNGAVVAQQTMGSFTPQTTYDLYLGRRISGADICTFSGLMDEVSIYNRALTAVEIQAIYAAGGEGKCYTPTAPAIYSQPTNQTVSVGGVANFSVAASGTPPLSYQWSFEGTNIMGATNTLLTLGNVQLCQAGNYTVLVTNLYGSILSSNAMLTLTLDHFTWSTIPSPRFVNTPFAINIQAQDMTNGLFTNFTGTAILSSTNGVAVTPPVSGIFVQGMWTGSVVISQTASNLVLQADDGFGHFGLANPINVINLPNLGMMQSGNIALFMWPAGYSGFVLETSGNLSPATWVVVPYAPIQFGDEYFLPLTMTGTNGFYRLWFPGP